MSHLISFDSRQLTKPTQESNVTVYQQDQKNNTQDKNFIKTESEVNFRGISNELGEIREDLGNFLQKQRSLYVPCGDVRLHEIQVDDSSYEGGEKKLSVGTALGRLTR